MASSPTRVDRSRLMAATNSAANASTAKDDVEARTGEVDDFESILAARLSLEDPSESAVAALPAPMSPSEAASALLAQAAASAASSSHKQHQHSNNKTASAALTQAQEQQQQKQQWKKKNNEQQQQPFSESGEAEEEDENEDEEEDESSEISASDEDGSWISWFCSLRGNEFFCEVDEDYIQVRVSLIRVWLNGSSLNCEDVKCDWLLCLPLLLKILCRFDCLRI